MDDPLTISLDDLERVFQALIQRVRDVAGSSVTFDQDYFWSVLPDDVFDVYQEPSELGVGQLSESLTLLREIADDPNGAIAFALTWLADVLRAIGLSTVG